MKLFDYMQNDDYEQINYCYDEQTGLKAIIAIHNTNLGPALGGLRMWPYETEEDAVIDALRLAKGMTYKNAAAGLKLGGGKAVIIGNPKTDKSPELFKKFGEFVDRLNGNYITAEDVGTTEEDMNNIAVNTEHVVGTTIRSGAGDPSPITAYGIYQGIKATAYAAFGTDSLDGKKIAVQGVGQVAFKLCEYLHEEGANLIVTDINEEAVARAVNKFNAKAVSPDDIYSVECDIYSPCALGGVINDETINKLNTKAIAGSANNQLKENKHGDLLHEKGILYAPDYVINSGGVINVYEEIQGYNKDKAMKKVAEIYQNLLRVYEISKKEGIPTYLAADRMAEERFSK